MPTRRPVQRRRVSRLTVAPLSTRLSLLPTARREAILAELYGGRTKNREPHELMDIGELAQALRLSTCSVYRLLREGPGKKCRAGDIRLIETAEVNGRTYWRRTSVEKFVRGE